MRSAPEAYNAWVDMHDSRLGGKLKPLIRLMKAWSYMNDTRLRSFWVEMRVTEWASTQSLISYQFDVLLSLAHIVNYFGEMEDPLGIGSPIEPCTPGRIDEARRRSVRDLEIAREALDSDQSGNVRAAFTKWASFFNGRFVNYG